MLLLHEPEPLHSHSTYPSHVIDTAATLPSAPVLLMQSSYDQVVKNLMLIPLNRTFLKRKGGLFKKAHELSVLCSVDVAVIIFGHNKKLYEYSSGDINDTIGRFQYVSNTRTIMCSCTRLTIRSMVGRMSTKDQPTSTAVPWMTMMMRIWDLRHSKTLCHASPAYRLTCKIKAICDIQLLRHLQHRCTMDIQCTRGRVPLKHI